ncbi:MAG TPA: GNAT family N-acetyltransferase, partial [Terriglobales bacterium]|nr:GNAT family N-acetyltransferase [Terriglobales bacterium]
VGRGHAKSVADLAWRPIISIPTDVELVAKMPPNSKLRSQLKQIRLRIQAQGKLKFSCTRSADSTALDRFYELEVSGWKGSSPGGLSVLKTGMRSFYNEVAYCAAREGYFSLYFLEMDEKLIAGHYSLTHRGHCYSPKVAYNEDYKQYAPGHLIISEILRDCAARGIHTFDITGQDQPWKMKWTSETRSVNHHFIFKGSLGILAHTVGSRLRTSLGTT